MKLIKLVVVVLGIAAGCWNVVALADDSTAPAAQIETTPPAPEGPLTTEDTQPLNMSSITPPAAAATTTTTTTTSTPPPGQQMPPQVMAPVMQQNAAPMQK